MTDTPTSNLRAAGANLPAPGSPVLVTRNGAIATLTLNRPDAANSIEATLAKAFRMALEQLAGDPSVRVLVLRGEGRVFCAGGDLESFSRQGPEAPAYVKGLIVDLHAGLHLLASFHAPIICAVQGAAAGAGLGLAMAADIVVADEGAKFVMAYAGAGLTPDGGTSWALPRIVGLRRALELTLLNRTFDAAEARGLGLVSEVVPLPKLASRVGELAEKFANGPTAAYATARRLLRGSLEASHRQQLDAEAHAIVASFATVDGQEGIQAFSERRAPQFHGL